MFDVKWEERALRELEKLPLVISSRIYKKVNELKDTPFSKIKRLKSSNYLSLRVGDYRIILSIEKNIIKIWKIGHRKNIYKRF